MIGNEIEKHDQFREQSVPILSQIEVQEIETAHKSVVSPCFPPMFSPFVKECFVEHDDGDKLELVLAGNDDETIRHISRGDPFANSNHFNKPPFRNINFNQIRWVEDQF